jgi:[protein-PII] uridylyltransferase
VRTVKEALAVADTDLKAVLGLLDARFVAGDAALCEQLLGELRTQWRRRAPKVMTELRTSSAARHARAGDVAFLLEPDLKEGRGGLRDVHAMRAAAAAWVVDAPPERVSAAYDVLLAARVELHRATGRGTDQLTLQEQDAVARALGHPDPTALMSSVSGAARSIAWALDETWRRVDAWSAGSRRRLSRPVRSRPLARGLAEHGGELVLAAGAEVATDPALALRAAAVAAEQALPLSTRLLERLSAEAPAPPEPWPASLRDELVRLLATGSAAIGAWESLDQYALVERLLPEWAAVRSRPQHNPYHRFTVDRHLQEAAAAAAPLARRVSRPDLLLVGTWLHDIGKGFPGDHTQVGVDVVTRVATRMGFSSEDCEVLVSMVRHHLLLPDAATRRDLDDPATAEGVAKAVGDRSTLELLAALSEADGIATGPSAWGPWKAGLVADLVRRAGALLDGARPEPVPGLVERHLDALQSGQLLVTADDDVVVVVAPDRPGLLWRVAGTLAIHRLDVRSATVGSHEGAAVQEIAVSASFGGSPDWPRVLDDVRRAVAGRLAVGPRLEERARAYAGRTSRPAATGPEILVDNDASASATVVEVRCDDSVGVLYRIARALADCDLDVRSARVTTLGHQVIDAFYVVDAHGAKVSDAEHLREVELAVRGELAR